VKHTTQTQQTHDYAVRGMTCSHCALGANLSHDAVKAAVVEAGYEVAA
jgi:copper chaperone CopZ